MRLKDVEGGVSDKLGSQKGGLAGLAGLAGLSGVEPEVEDVRFPWLVELRALMASAQAHVMAMTFPMRTGATKNRLFTLLTWDTRCFEW